MVDLQIDYWFCEPKVAHIWTYRGKGIGYRCNRCGTIVTKEALKENTDA